MKMKIHDSVAHVEPIPQPPERFLLKNLPDIEGPSPILELMRLAHQYGPIFQLNFPNGRQQVVVSGFELVDELCDESRFDKQLGPSLQNARRVGGDGLFTAYTNEPNWHKAHNILLPNFSLQAMQRYLPMMIDIAEQLMEKWERLNADDEVDVTADMTRLTLDIIGLCGFGYRFNSFYRERPHPFIQSMVRSLAEVQESMRRLPIQDKLMLQKHHQFQADVEFMYDMADRIIKERKEGGASAADTKDLLSYMLTGVDKQSDETLDERNIRYQMITFLVAGHETTSGLLSFTLYYLLRNPAVLARACQEVSRVLGTDPRVPPTFAQIHQLTYLSQILKEILRLWPTAPAFSRQPLADETILGGKYMLRKEQIVTILTPMLHRDESVWGEDAEAFNPDHFSSEAEQRRPANAYKPFGTGQRACIGRQFAMQEATLMLAMMLQRFHLIDHKHYQLKVKQTLSLKPDGFTIQVKKRTDLGRTGQVAPAPQTICPAEPVADVPFNGLACPHLMQAGSLRGFLGNGTGASSASPGLNQVGSDARGYAGASTLRVIQPEQKYAADLISLCVGTPAPLQVAFQSSTPAVAVSEHSTPLLVLYGSNLGTSEDIAERIAEDGRARGFTTVAGPLDEYVNRLPKEGAVIIVSASYNGTPPDNATRFYHWLKDATLMPESLQGVNYAVFGCGNREWAATFQAVPRFIDSALEQHGARRIYRRGEGDASGDFDGQFQSWYRPLWSALAQAFSLDLEATVPAATGSLYRVEVLSKEQASQPHAASFGACPMTLLENRELQVKSGPHASDRGTRHIEIALPAGVSYGAGDHLGVLAHNSERQVRRVLARFNFDSTTRVRLHKNDTRKTYLPINEPMRVFDLLTDYVELQDVATRTQLKRMIEYLPVGPNKEKLVELSGDDEASVEKYRQEILEKRKSLIDLLEEFPECDPPFSVYLELLLPIKPRYYSISSSPLIEPNRCSITVGVVRGLAKSGQGTFEGVCSTYLSHLERGDSVYAFVQDTKSRFRPPEDPGTPIIMIGPGTGLAPFRGFLQERAALKAQGKALGKTLLFFGCRHPHQDFIYEDELQAYAAQGITELFTAFSRLDGHKMYVQDKIKAAKEEVWQMIQAGAIIYICGDASKMAPDVRKTFATLYQEKTGTSEQEAEHWLNELTTQNRFLVDVWGS